MPQGSIFFKHDRIYTHNIARVNYTTYDVRRAQDVFNPATSHCNMTVLAGMLDVGQDPNIVYPFGYAQVLGIYHANIVYTGPRMIDYQPC
jgi:hypothetical protein